MFPGNSALGALIAFFIGGWYRPPFSIAFFYPPVPSMGPNAISAASSLMCSGLPTQPGFTPSISATSTRFHVDDICNGSINRARRNPLSVMSRPLWADVRLVKALVPGPHGCLTAENVSFSQLLTPEDHPYTIDSTLPHAT